MDLGEMLERVQSDSNSVQKLFESKSNEDGVPVRSVRRDKNPKYKRKLAEAGRFLADIYSGTRHISQFQEAMTTSDFPFLFGDILDRTVLATYLEWPSTWDQLAKKVMLNDFKDAKVFPPTYGADGPLDVVMENDTYPDARIYEQTPFTWHVEKYGRTVPFSWESMINDDLDQLKDIPDKLGRAARRTESGLVTGLYVDTNGPHASFYTSGNKNIVSAANGANTTNPALTIAGLQDAYTVLNNMLDEAGYPIRREVITLVVPPSLEVIAQNILNAQQLWITAAAAGGDPGNGTTVGFQQLNVNNWMRSKLNLVVDPFIPLVATNAHGATSWWIFSSPTYSREAMRIGFLRGHDTPEMWMKSPNAIRIGSGGADPMNGDFDTDSITYKVRHVTGAIRVDYKATVASNGSGS